VHGFAISRLSASGLEVEWGGTNGGESGHSGASNFVAAATRAPDPKDRRNDAGGRAILSAHHRA